MNIISGKRYIILWLLLPVIAVIAYDFRHLIPGGLKSFTIVLTFIAVFFSIIIHEISHGLASYICGDTTAYNAGRLTLNPVAHISVIGSIILPLILYLTKAPAILGWAKPVPLDPVKLRVFPGDQIFSVLAGPLSNFLLAYISFICFLVTGFFFTYFNPGVEIPSLLSLFDPVEITNVFHAGFFFVMFHLLNAGILVNLSLGVFNLVPFPPLDGFWVLKTVFPQKVVAFLTRIQVWGFLLIIIAVQFHLFSIFVYPIMLIYGSADSLISFLLR